MGYHRILCIVSASRNAYRVPPSPPEIKAKCPACGGDIKVWPDETEMRCDYEDCDADISITRNPDGGVSLSSDDEYKDKDDDGWEIPKKLYHGTSLKQFKEMLASSKSFKLYLASSESGTTGYAENASANDGSVGVTVVFDTEKLSTAGQLWPDWDDVDTMITNGDTDAEGVPLFGDANSAIDVSWIDSLRLINTCSYEGDLSETIIEVQLGDGKVVKPPFRKLSAWLPPAKLYHGTFDWNSDDIDSDEDDCTASRWWRAAVAIKADHEPTVSFDFDDVLHYAPGGNPIDFWTPESYVPRERYVAKLRSLSPTHRVIVVSHRDPGMEDVVYEFAKMHDLDIDDVFCVGVCGSKRRVLESEDAAVHYDDSPYVESELHESKTELVKVPQTAIDDLAWVPDSLWDKFSEIYQAYAEKVGATPL